MGFGAELKGFASGFRQGVQIANQTRDSQTNQYRFGKPKDKWIDEQPGLGQGGGTVGVKDGKGGGTDSTTTSSTKPGEIEQYIRQAAVKYNINPDIAVKVAHAEGGLNDPYRHGEGKAPKSQKAGYGATENSIGPFQLYISGTGAGLGDRALAAGIDPRKDWKGGIDFALAEASKKGWGQWYGAAKAKIGDWDGIGGSHRSPSSIRTDGGVTPDAAHVGVPEQTKDDDFGGAIPDDDEEEEDSGGSAPSPAAVDENGDGIIDPGEISFDLTPVYLPEVDVPQVETMFAAEGGVIPEEPAMAPRPTPDAYNASRNYTQPIPAAGQRPTFVPRRISAPGTAPTTTPTAPVTNEAGRTTSQQALFDARATRAADLAAAEAAAAEKAAAEKAAADKAAADKAAKEAARQAAMDRWMQAMRGQGHAGGGSGSDRGGYTTSGRSGAGSFGSRSSSASRSSYGGGGLYEEGGMVQNFAEGGMISQEYWEKAVKREKRSHSQRGTGESARDVAAKRINQARRGVTSSAMNFDEDAPAAKKAKSKGGGAKSKGGGAKSKTEKSPPIPTPRPEPGDTTASVPTPTPRPDPSDPAIPETVGTTPRDTGRLSPEYTPTPPGPNAPVQSQPAPGRLSDENTQPEYELPGEGWLTDLLQEQFQAPNVPTGPTAPKLDFGAVKQMATEAVQNGSTAALEKLQSIYEGMKQRSADARRPVLNIPEPQPATGDGFEEIVPSFDDFLGMILNDDAGPDPRLMDEQGPAPRPGVRQIPGFAAGGAVPEEDEEPRRPLSPRMAEANYTTSAPGHVGASSARAPAPAPEPVAEEAPAKRGSHVKPTKKLQDDVAVALDGGIQFLTRHFNLGGEGAIPSPADGPARQEGAARMARGEGAATPQELKGIDDKIDPQRQLDEGQRQMNRIAQTMQFYQSAGRKDEAEAAAASLLQYGASRFSQLGSTAAQQYGKYEQTGDKDYLQGTINMLEQAYKMVPDGAQVDVSINSETGDLQITRIDANGNEEDVPIKARDLPGIIRSVQDTSSYWNSIYEIADPSGAKEARTAKRTADAADLAYDRSLEKQRISQEFTEGQADKRQEASDARFLLADQKALEREQRAEDRQIEMWKRSNPRIDWTVVGPLQAEATQAKRALGEDAEDEELQADYNYKVSRLIDALQTQTKDVSRELDKIGIWQYEYVPAEGGAAPAAPGETAPPASPETPPAEGARKPPKQYPNAVWVDDHWEVTVNGVEYVLEEQ